MTVSLFCNFGRIVIRSVSRRGRGGLLLTKGRYGCAAIVKSRPGKIFPKNLMPRSFFNHGLIQDFGFSLIISGLFQGARKDIPHSTLWFSWLKKTKYQKRFLLSVLNLKGILNSLG